MNARSDPRSASALIGLRRSWWGLVGKAERLVVLAYHRIYDIGAEDSFPYDPDLVSASPAEFDWQMRFVRRHFNVVTFAQLIRALDGGKALPRRSIIVTFDDGYRDNFEHAFPVLRSLGLPATIFVSTGYVGGRDTFWFDRVAFLVYRAPDGPLAVPGTRFVADLHDIASRRAAARRLQKLLKGVANGRRLEILASLEKALGQPEQPDYRGTPLNWREVRSMSRAGIEIGSHGVTHAILTRLDDEQLDFELCESRRAIVDNVGACDVIAYPVGGRGAFDRRVAAAAIRCGYKLGVNYVPGTNALVGFDRFAIRRLPVERYTTRQQFQWMLSCAAGEWLEPPASAAAPARGAKGGNGHAGGEFGPWSFAIAEHGGWQYLLDLGRRGGAILCYDCSGGTTAMFLARIFRRVVVVHSQADELQAIEARLSGEKLDGVTCHRVSAPGDLASLPAAPYAGIVVHDPGARFVNIRDPGAGISLEALLQASHGLLQPGALVFVGMRNRHSYLRLRMGNRPDADRWALTPAELRRTLEASGLHAIKSYPVLLEGERMRELLPDRGLHAPRMAGLREKIKAALLNPWGARRFASGYALTASKGGQLGGSTLERLLDGHRRYGLPLPPGPLELHRYLVLNWGNVIVSVGRRGAGHAEFVLVLTALPQATAGRRREADVLRSLLARELKLARFIPRFLGEFPVEGATCFVMRAFPGVSIDGPVRCLERLTAEAMDFITAFHSETRCDAVTSPGVYAELFGRLFERARTRNAPLADALATLEKRVRDRVAGTSLPVVWLHGDFKIENMIFDDRSHELLGVIDWEHSEERGLPMLDPLYLIVYNRTLRDSIDVLTALEGLIRRGMTAAEDGLLERYCGSLGVERSMHAALQAMFFVHHIGVRYRYALDSGDTLRRVRGMIDLLAESAARPAVDRG